MPPPIRPGEMGREGRAVVVGLHAESLVFFFLSCEDGDLSLFPLTTTTTNHHARARLFFDRSAEPGSAERPPPPERGRVDCLCERDASEGMPVHAAAPADDGDDEKAIIIALPSATEPDHRRPTSSVASETLPPKQRQKRRFAVHHHRCGDDEERSRQIQRPPRGRLRRHQGHRGPGVEGPFFFFSPFQREKKTSFSLSLFFLPLFSISFSLHSLHPSSSSPPHSHQNSSPSPTGRTRRPAPPRGGSWPPSSVSRSARRASRCSSIS